jgi:hypothetical protein
MASRPTLVFDNMDEAPFKPYRSPKIRHSFDTSSPASLSQRLLDTIARIVFLCHLFFAGHVENVISNVYYYYSSFWAVRPSREVSPERSAVLIMPAAEGGRPPFLASRTT